MHVQRERKYKRDGREMRTKEENPQRIVQKASRTSFSKNSLMFPSSKICPNMKSLCFSSKTLHICFNFLVPTVKTLGCTNACSCAVNCIVSALWFCSLAHRGKLHSEAPMFSCTILPAFFFIFVPGSPHFGSSSLQNKEGFH